MLLTGTRILPGRTPTASGVSSASTSRLNWSISTWAAPALLARRSEIVNTMYKRMENAPPAMVAIGLVNRFTTAIKNRSEEHTSELQSRGHLVCRLLLEKKNKDKLIHTK